MEVVSIVSIREEEVHAKTVKNNHYRCISISSIISSSIISISIVNNQLIIQSTARIKKNDVTIVFNYIINSLFS